MAIRVQEAASLRLDEIYRYTRDRWGTEQAERYITELFAALDNIEVHGVASRSIPAEFGVEGMAQAVTDLIEQAAPALEAAIATLSQLGPIS